MGGAIVSSKREALIWLIYLKLALAPRSPEFVPELDRLAAEAMADWKVPGAALAVVQDCKVCSQGLRSARCRGKPSGYPETQFRSSRSPILHCHGCGALHHEGRLDWTKPVRDYHAGVSPDDAVATERVTVLDLLCHQSGLPRHDWVHLPGDLRPPTCWQHAVS